MGILNTEGKPFYLEGTGRGEGKAGAWKLPSVPILSLHKGKVIWYLSQSNPLPLNTLATLTDSKLERPFMGRGKL